jgi:hypothetical protein
MVMKDERQFNLSTGWKIPDCECLPGCNELSYVASMTYSHMNASFAVNKGYLDETDLLNETNIR